MLNSILNVFIIYHVVEMVVAQYTLTGSADHAVARSSFTFTCETGSSVSSILWTIAGTPYTVDQGTETTCNIGAAPSEFEYTCSGGTTYTVKINSVSFSQRGTEWRCANAFGGSDSTTIFMTVYVDLSNVSFTIGPDVIDPGNMTVVQCSTNPCYPTANITWIMDDRKITDAITRSTKTTATGVITTSNMTRNFTRADDKKQIVCSADNGVAKVNSKAFVINLIDLNECELNTHDCHSNADCHNTDGSYTCECKTGYTGDGKSCDGASISSGGASSCDSTCIIGIIVGVWLYV